MNQSIRDVMTPNPITLPATSTAADAARAMRDAAIGDVIVLDDNDAVCGIVTDRDLTVRALAEQLDPASMQLADICTRALVTLSPADSAEDAVRMMREQSCRRLPIVDQGNPVGIVSLGDLAVARDPSSALADISAAPANA
jgi:CBS domain-containing protein